MEDVIFDNIKEKTKSELCCISFDGLKRLYELRMMGEPLPSGWQSHVWEYLRRKSRNIQRKQEDVESPTAKIKLWKSLSKGAEKDVGSPTARKEKEQYMEAVAIARCLHTEKVEETPKC